MNVTDWRAQVIVSITNGKLIFRQLFSWRDNCNDSICLQINNLMLQTQHQKIAFTLRGFLNIDNTLAFTVSIRMTSSEGTFLVCFYSLQSSDYWSHHNLFNNFNTIFTITVN